MAAILFAFLVGVSVGVLIGRRYSRAGEHAAAPAAAPVAAPSLSSRPPVTGVPAGAPTVAPNKRARKAGLTEESFRPADDILEKLRLVAEGHLEPTALGDDAAGDRSAEAAAPAPESDAPPLANPHLSDAERRVLERLREAQRDEPSSFS